MNITVETMVVIRHIDAITRKVVKESLPKKNLVMDNGLNALAQSTNLTYTAEFTNACRVGSGNTSDKIGSGAITFTQTGTTVTASAGFFTAAMVGYIFKYGTGTAGVEYYITAFTNSTTVTVDTSATVAVPTLATVWNVTRSTLETLLFTHSSYETTGGACGTTVSGNTLTHLRTYNFAQQVSSYNVNEVGYFRANVGTSIFGRLVLGATEVVAPTNFLQVALTCVFTYSPSVPTAVSDVGTNINTAGNAMVESLSTTRFSFVTSTGSQTQPASGARMDGGGGITVKGIVSAYTQNATPGALLNPTTLTFVGATWTYAAVRGKMTATTNTTISASGQTMTGVGLGSTGSDVAMDVKLTTPFVLPTGSFLPQCVFSCTYNRQLNN